MDVNDSVRAYMAHIGKRGGRKSKRTLSPEQARRMVAVREARRSLPSYEKLFEQIRQRHPLVASAINDVDETVFEGFEKLTLCQRMERAAAGARTLRGLRRQ